MSWLQIFFECFDKTFAPRETAAFKAGNVDDSVDYRFAAGGEDVLTEHEQRSLAVKRDFTDHGIAKSERTKIIYLDTTHHGVKP